MAMAALSFFPAISISDLSSPRRLPTLVTACSSSAGKSRARRKAMSDSDLCKGLREFVSSVGFPDGHVPSTKQLADHGRKDLANIVRRRGHKAVKELLANSNKSEMESCLTEGRNLARHLEVDATGEKEKVKDLTQEALDMMQGVSSLLNESRMRFGSNVRFDDKFGMPIGSLNGTAVMSTAITNSESSRNRMRDNDASLKSPAGSAFRRDMNFETSEMERQDEAEHLKKILQQKELEICQLKELIEKEKQALSTLKSKAEVEIENAQKLISEMDAELLAAEETLAGLKEVQIQYTEEARMVEVAGSFNGWHQPIKMDPHPDDASKDPLKTRKPREWYLSLWLYPGEYEVKFIVDGEWKVDPEREITTRSGMQNNILRVDG